jgi:diguanylate cyclase (GGDEF)-like protein
MATPLGILTLALIWGASNYFGTLLWLDYYALPVIAIFLLLQVFFLWIRLLPIRGFEFCVYSLAFIFFTIKIFTVLQGAIFEGDLIESAFLTLIPFIYILGFGILDTLVALLCSLSFLLVNLLFGFLVIFQTGTFDAANHNINLLIETYISSIFYIFILYLMARIREHYVKSQVTADLMSNLAMTDSLTQVDNRRQLEKHLDDEVKRADRHRTPLAVIMFDIDNFKRINDRFGHANGDLVLVKTAQIVSKNLRKTDRFGRWGGDEFLCLATNTNEDTAIRLAERLRKEIESAEILETVAITGSFGVTRYVRGDMPDVLVRRADMRLLRAKHDVRNRVVTIPPETTLPV